MEEVLNMFSSMNTNDMEVSKHEQLYMFREEIIYLLKNGCNEYQYTKFNNFNQLIKFSVNLNDDIYPERLSGLLFLIRENLDQTESGDIFKRLLYSFNLYNSILALLRVVDETETEKTYNYYKESSPKTRNDNFWNEW
jgi:hypothetical protein